MGADVPRPGVRVIRRYGRCPVCGVSPYALTKDGRLFRHDGITSSGFSSGERCAGTGEPEKKPGDATACAAANKINEGDSRCP